MIQHLPKPHKWILFFIILLMVLGTTIPVLADYLGPNRIVTTTVAVCKVVLYECKEVEPDKWKDKSTDSWSCSNESKPWEAYDSGGACHSGNNHHKHWEREETTETITTTYDPATITGSIQNCTLQNGWCNGATAPELALSASEPVPGYNILLIEGTLNGANFACPAGAINCNVPLTEGGNTFNYWALSSWGDSSEMGTNAVQVDTVPPTVDLPHAWQLGRDVNYSVRDDGSGLAAVRVVIEDEDERYAKVTSDRDASGASYSSHINWDGVFRDKTVAPPGTYLVWIKASDLAGNETFQLGKVIVPEPNYVGVVALPTEEPSVLSPAPPVELSSSANPSSSAGAPSGTMTVGTGTSKHVLSGVSGSAGGLPAASSSSASGVLWGAAAAAIAGAATTYALETTRKRLEAEAEQAAQVKAQIASDEKERAEKKQKQQDNYNKQQAILKAQQEKERQAVYNAHIDEKMAKLDAQDEAKWEAAQATMQKREEQAAINARMEKKEKKKEQMSGYFNSEKHDMGKVVAAPVRGHEPPWWDEAIQKIGQVIPEVAWTPLNKVQNAQVLQNLSKFGQYGPPTLDYMKQNDVQLGFLPQKKSGGGWTFLGNISLVPDANLNDPFTITAIVHETKHLKQPFWERLSISGELKAWQLSYEVYYGVTGKHFGEPGTPVFNNTSSSAEMSSYWHELSQLSPDSREDLVRARKLMKTISPEYRANVLPLRPIDKPFTKDELIQIINLMKKIMSIK